jgi:hypothetical protein
MGQKNYPVSDPSLNRSAGTTTLRGALLLALAVVLGTVLLQATDENDPFSRVSTRAERDEVPVTTTITTLPQPTTTLLPARKITILTVNGTIAKGLAGQVRDQLVTLGYSTLPPTDTAKKPVAKSGIYYNPDFENEARAIAEALNFSPSSVQEAPPPPLKADRKGADVIVVVGEDQAEAINPDISTTTTRTGTRTPTTTKRAATATTTKRSSTTTTTDVRSRVAPSTPSTTSTVPSTTTTTRGFLDL